MFTSRSIAVRAFHVLETATSMQVVRTLLAAAPLLLLLGCGKSNTYVEPPPPEVTVQAPVQQTVTEYLEFSGVAQPIETVEVRARVQGFLKEIHFTEGAEVKQGQLLLVIDEEPFQIKLEAAEVKLKAAEVALRQAQESKAREIAQAQLALDESQLLLARQDEQRDRALFARNAFPESDLEKTIATRKTAEAKVQSSRATLEQATATYETEIMEAQAQVAAAQVEVRNATLDLSYCRMHAPIDGRISRVNFDVGNLVGSGQASVLATIVRLDPIYAYANVSEDEYLRARELTSQGLSATGKGTSLPAELAFGGQGEFAYAGEIDYTDPVIDPGTGTLQARGIFANPDRSILPGMFVRMRVPIGQRPDALLVPVRALGTDQTGNYVLVVGKDGAVEHRSVQAGVEIDGMRVVEGKLAPGEQVVVDGLLRARPGLKVTPKTLSPAPSPDSTAGPSEYAGRL